MPALNVKNAIVIERSEIEETIKLLSLSIEESIINKDLESTFYELGQLRAYLEVCGEDPFKNDTYIMLARLIKHAFDIDILPKE